MATSHPGELEGSRRGKFAPGREEERVRVGLQEEVGDGVADCCRDMVCEDRVSVGVPEPEGVGSGLPVGDQVRLRRGEGVLEGLGLADPERTARRVLARGPAPLTAAPDRSPPLLLTPNTTGSGNPTRRGAQAMPAGRPGRPWQ